MTTSIVTSLLILTTTAGCGEIVTVVPDAGPDGIAEPDTTLTVTPDEVFGVRLQRFEFVSMTADATFECELDDAAPAPCMSPYEVLLEDGPHTIAVAAVNGASRDPSPATYAWLVDTQPPQIAITAGPFQAQTVTSSGFAFKWTVSDASPATTVCGLYVTGTPPALTPCVSPSSYMPVVLGAATRFTWKIVSKDVVGNDVAIQREFTFSPN